MYRGVGNNTNMKPITEMVCNKHFNFMECNMRGTN